MCPPKSKKPTSSEKQVDYVDEDGNPVDPDSIDPNEMDFSDEFGRPTDQTGKLLNELVEEDLAISIAESLLFAGKTEELLAHSKSHLVAYPRSSPLLSFQGFAYGSLGDGPRARSSFLESLNADPTNAMALANYFTACLHSNDIPSAVDGLKLFFGGMDDDCKGIVVESVIEALKTKALQVEELPEEIIPFINQKIKKLKSSSSKKIRMTRIQTNEFLELWDYEETKIKYSDLLIKRFGQGYTDKELIDFLNFTNSYCQFEILIVDEKKT